MGKKTPSIVERLLVDVDWEQFREPEMDALENSQGVLEIPYEKSDAFAFQDNLRGDTSYEPRSYAAANIRRARRASDRLREAMAIGVDMQAYIPTWQLTEIIRLATLPHTKKIADIKDSLNTSVTYFFKRHKLSQRVVNFYEDHKETHPALCLRSPGFYYVFESEKLGYKLDFWVEPDIPRFFKQQSEPAIIDADTKMRVRLRRRIENYYEALGVRYKYELQCANRLWHVKTARDLLTRDEKLFGVYLDNGVMHLTRRAAKLNLLGHK